jgi:hypothetical protein
LLNLMQKKTAGLPAVFHGSGVITAGFRAQ